MTEQQFEDWLQTTIHEKVYEDKVYDDVRDTPPPNFNMKTLQEAGRMTVNKGLIVLIGDSTFQLIITRINK